MLRRASLVLVLVACSSSSSDATPEPGPVRVDADDVFCDPVDGMPEDAAPAIDTAEPLVQWVDPRIGTGGVGFAVGTTYPGPQVPYGMAKPGPDTSKNGHAQEASHCSGYAWDDDTIEAFSHARVHGAGIADYGGVALMPGLGPITAAKAGPRRHGSRFSHDTEVTRPGYYAVTLDDTKVRVELTATARVANHRYTFPAGAAPLVYVDAAHVLSEGNTVSDASVTVDAKLGEITGSSLVQGSYSSRYGGVRIHFVVRFDRAPVAAGTYVKGAPSDGVLTASGEGAGAYLGFDGATLEAHVGLSYVDEAHARANLDAESVPFDAARSAAEATWEKRLGVMRVQARSDRDRRVAYTALYHTAMMPSLASDVDGSYRGIDGQVHHADGFRYYTDFSLWDTYRTLHPLVTLLYPDDARDFAASLTAMGKEAGFVPRWPLGTGETGGMVGDGGAIVLADTWMRGVRGWDAEGAYAVLRAQAMVPGDKARDALADYMALGYVPKDGHSDSAGKTLEYAHADHALGELAAALGHAEDAATLHARGQSWRNVYDEAQHFFVGRRKDGAFDPVNPVAASEDFSEGTPWHYAFMVPHDAAGLAGRIGKPMLVARAEQLFTRAACNPNTPAFLPNPYYWPSNEPVLFSGWIFSALGDQERTARWTRWTSLVHYGDGPDGLPGNDDGGTMSAFWLFAALGLYPVAGTDQWILGSPLFPRATLGSLVIDAPGASKKTRFPSRVMRNGAPTTSTLKHADLPGATLSYTLAAEPSAAARMP